MELDAYSFVLLKRGPRALEYSDEGLGRASGAAPRPSRRDERTGASRARRTFSDQADETLRGFCLYRTSVEETRRLAESDPSVQAGRMAVDVMGWWTKRGSLPF